MFFLTFNESVKLDQGSWENEIFSKDKSRNLSSWQAIMSNSLEEEAGIHIDITVSVQTFTLLLRILNCIHNVHIISPVFFCTLFPTQSNLKHVC